MHQVFAVYPLPPLGHPFWQMSRDNCHTRAPSRPPPPAAAAATARTSCHLSLIRARHHRRRHRQQQQQRVRHVICHFWARERKLATQSYFCKVSSIFSVNFDLDHKISENLRKKCVPTMCAFKKLSKNWENNDSFIGRVAKHVKWPEMPKNAIKWNKFL